MSAGREKLQNLQAYKEIDMVNENFTEEQARSYLKEMLEILL